tara:strand:- start:1903 stop:2073 length:171 start_codon:yes stop_codon:yes gene_type:complete
MKYLTYLFYIIYWSLLTLALPTYAVMEMGADILWIFMGIVIFGFGFSPKDWGQYFD